MADGGLEVCFHCGDNYVMETGDFAFDGLVKGKTIVLVNSALYLCSCGISPAIPRMAPLLRLVQADGAQYQRWEFFQGPHGIRDGEWRRDASAL